jgi:hypothetical protein
MKLQTPVSDEKCIVGISYTDQIMMLGSCFSDSIGSQLYDYGFNVCVNPFGTLYNPISILQSVRLLTSDREFTESDCVQMGAGAGLICSFSHHTSFARSTKEDFISNANDSLTKAREFFKACNKVIITLGTSWCFRDVASDTIVSNCLKRPAGEFVRERLTVAEVKNALKTIMDLCPDKEFIFTVSPIRHFKDGAHGNQISKSTLLIGIEEAISLTEKADYFPSYEIMMDELRDYRFYAEDMCHPTQQAVDYIRERFLQWALPPSEHQQLDENIRSFKRSRHISKLTALAIMLFTVFTTSCSKALLDDNSVFKGNHDLIITGTVSDNLLPLEGIKVTFDCNGKRQRSVSQTVYTDSRGIYWISLQELSGILSCSIKAEDLENGYTSQTSSLTVDWTGPSFVGNTFYVNDLNISLKKKNK